MNKFSQLLLIATFLVGVTASNDSDNESTPPDPNMRVRNLMNLIDSSMRSASL